MNCLFSIIIPTFNASLTLPSALNSLRLQNCKDFEVIIVDGLSTDGTGDIVEQYSNDLQISFLSEKDRGIYDAMNKGIAMSTGRWLYFMGSDDSLYNSDVLRKIAGNINEGIDVIYGNSIWLPEYKEEKGAWSFERLLNQSINHQRIFYKRILFRDFGMFNIRYPLAADHEFNIRMFNNAVIKWMHVDLTVAFYNSGGLSSKHIDENFWNDWRSILLKNFKHHVPLKKIYLRLSWYCWYNIRKKKKSKGVILFFVIFCNTLSISFLRHTLSQTLKMLKG